MDGWMDGWRSLTSGVGLMTEFNIQSWIWMEEFDIWSWIDGGVKKFEKSEVGFGGKFDIWSWMDGGVWHVELDGRRSLTCGVGRKTRSGSGLWDVEGLLRRRTVESALESLSRSSLCLSFCASSPQSRHRYSQRNQQQTASLWALQAPVLWLLLFL